MYKKSTKVLLFIFAKNNYFKNDIPDQTLME